MNIMQLYLRHLFIPDAMMQLKEDSANYLSKAITYAHKCNPILFPHSPMISIQNEIPLGKCKKSTNVTNAKLQI